MALQRDELAVRELDITLAGVLRLWLAIAGLLTAALFVDIPWIVGLCWLVLALLFFPLLQRWGYTGMALLLGTIPGYAYLAMYRPPLWLAYVSAFVAFLAGCYVCNRLRQIRKLRARLADNRSRTVPPFIDSTL